MVFLISFASALEIDNVYSYDKVTREATFHNTFLGIKTTEIGKARLDSPLNVVMKEPGYQNVGNFTLWAYGDYNDALKPLKIKNMKTKQDELRTADYLIIDGYKEQSVNDYDIICNSLWSSENKTYYQDCNKEIVGSHTELQAVYKKLTPADLKKNENIKVQIWAEVKLGDYMDWRPTIFYKEVSEWATWTAPTKIGVTAYYKLDENVGNGTAINSVSVGTYDGVVTGATQGATGILNNAVTFAGSNNRIVSDSGLAGDTTVSASVWFKTTESTASTLQPIIVLQTEEDGGASPNEGFYVGYQDASNPKLNILIQGVAWSSGSCPDSNDGNWHNFVITKNGNIYSIYQDGVTTACATLTNSGGIFTSDKTLIGYRGALTPTATDISFKGTIDEVAIWDRVINSTEITEVYGGGTPPDFNETISPDNPPTITLNSPIDNINYTTSPIQINFSCYGSDDINLSSVGLYIDGSLDQLNASGINNTNYTFTKTLTEGNYNWTCEGTDNESQTTKPTERTFRIHTTAPDSVIHYPTGVLNYHLSGDQLILNWTINETGVNLTTHITNCTYNYNGVVTEINNTVCTQTNQTTFTPVPGVNTLNFTITDEFGLTNTSSTTWNIKVFEINQSYNNETTEGSLETFLATLRLGSGYSISDAVLFSYNGTTTTGQSFASGSNTVLRKTDYLIPSVDADTNITFYWNITLSDSTNLQLSYKNQTIYNLDLDNCSSNTVELFNFTVVDEETQDVLPNATIEIAINVYDENREELILNYSNLFEKENPLRICMNRNLSSDSMYSVDTVVRYEDTGNANEYYNIVNQELTNGTESQNIILYDLNLTDSTEFQLSFTGSDFLPVENALVYVDRQYISENTFKTVELPKTDYNGQSVLHLVRNDVIYNIRIIKDGVVLGNFENLVAFCDDFTIGDCNIELNAFDSVESIFNIDEALGIIYTTPVYNETANTISFNFLTEDGTAKTVLLSVTRNDIFGNRSICNSTLISSGGTLTCNIDPNIDESVLVVSIYVDGMLAVKGSVDLDTTNFGVAGYLVMFVMAISFILMFSGSKTGVLISIGLTFAGALGMGIVSGELIGIGASGIWLLVIIFIGIYKLNKERQA